MMAGLLTKELRVALGARVWSPPVWALLLALAGILFFCRLGMWQLGRAEEKALMTSRYEARIQSPALPLEALLALQDIEDRKVVVAGHWDNGRQVFLENQMRGPQAGFHVYTVFLPDSGHAGVLVNRGWVPVGQDVQQLPEVAAASSQKVGGTVAYPSDFFTVGKPDYTRKPVRVSRLDIPELSAALGVELQPFVVRLDATAPDGFVREWAPAARLGMVPEKHQAYAFQWFSLALAVLVVLLVVNLRKNGDPET